jgi:uncharacterized protein (TIGR00290 family)
MDALLRQQSTATNPARPERIAMCFSGGKDSVLALWDIQRAHSYSVAELLTTVTAEYDRVSMHGVRRTLLREQASALGIPLTEVTVPPNSTNAVYERQMGQAFARLHQEGIRRVAFGDIFLEDLRSYREQQLARFGLSCVFPLWHQNTTHLARRFIEGQFRGVVVCVNPSQVDRVMAGHLFDDAFLAALSPLVDPCGENGEFHTFVFDGPIFRWPIAVHPGRIVDRNGFVFCDLVGQGGHMNVQPSGEEVEQ